MVKKIMPPFEDGDKHINSMICRFNEIFILDACCGGREFWFNKDHKHTVYMDIRNAEKGHITQQPNHSVNPDIVSDFRSIPFEDSTFKLVVFDPPHVRHLSEGSILRKKWGCLSAQTWQSDIKGGFNECWRVLRDYGVLIFKWSETDIPLKEVLKLFSVEPLLGHTTGSKENTKWLTFMKIPQDTPPDTSESVAGTTPSAEHNRRTSGSEASPKPDKSGFACPQDVNGNKTNRQDAEED